MFIQMACSYFRLQPGLQNLWLAITSDSNPFFKMGKTRRQKDGCSFYRVKFIRAWITLHPCTLDLMYASVHHFLYKKRNILFITNTFPLMILSESICTKLGGTMKFFENQSNLKLVIKFITQSMTSIYFGFTFRHWLRGRVIFSKFYVSSKLSTLCTKTLQ